jgi:hypothetical protein
MIRAIWGFTKLFFQTFSIVGQAIFEVVFTDRKNGRIPYDGEHPFRKITAREREERRMRREKELIQQFKARTR